MIQLEGPRVLSGEVLSPDAEVPPSVRFPRVEATMRFAYDMTLGVRLADGGRWRFSEHALHDLPWRPERLDGELVQHLFDRRAMRFDGRRA